MKTVLRPFFKVIPILILSLLISLPLFSASKTRVKKKAPEPAETQPENVVDFTGTFVKGDKIEILWDGAWYKGRVENVVKKELEKARYKVSFDGYWHNWDKEVNADAVRRIPQRVRSDPDSLAKGDSIEYIEGGDHWIPGVFMEKKDKKEGIVQITKGKKTKEEKVPLYKIYRVQ